MLDLILAMLDLILMLFNSLLMGLRARAVMQAEIIALRHKLAVLRRTQKSKRLALSRGDRRLWVWLSRVWSRWRSALFIVRPETVNHHGQFNKEIPFRGWIDQFVRYAGNPDGVSIAV
jgi:hypothetical protein